MSDTYAAPKQINAQLSNINAGGQALSTVDSLSTLKLLSHFDFNAPANIEAAIDVMQNLSSTMKYIVREVSAIMNLPPEQMERKIATIAPLLREKVSGPYSQP